MNKKYLHEDDLDTVYENNIPDSYYLPDDIKNKTAMRLVLIGIGIMMFCAIMGSFGFFSK
ncbi:MAG TPA: hypothetical protein VJY62_02610 [Bacteroidia bacterium]|nr:hypothetical protein [Bacteroidia bacterium]